MPSKQNAGGRDANLSDSSTRLPEEVWEKMYKAMWEYRFGRINFLELLDKWEELLGIKPPASEITSSQKRVHELPCSEKQE